MENKKKKFDFRVNCPLKGTQYNQDRYKIQGLINTYLFKPLNISRV